MEANLRHAVIKDFVTPAQVAEFNAESAPVFERLKANPDPSDLGELSKEFYASVSRFCPAIKGSGLTRLFLGHDAYQVNAGPASQNDVYHHATSPLELGDGWLPLVSLAPLSPPRAHSS